MSHFLVLVPAKDLGDLEARLMPYHEYECTGIEQYIEFVDDHDTVTEGWKSLDGLDRSEYKDIDQYADIEFGYINKDGRFGRFTNPNAKWDWWTVGGRWGRFLKLKSKYQDGVSYSPAGDIDWGTERDGMYEISQEAPVFAFIDESGNWHQKGEMGWWGFVDESQKTMNFDYEFWAMIDRLPDDMMVYAVDCHI